MSKLVRVEKVEIAPAVPAVVEERFTITLTRKQATALFTLCGALSGCGPCTQDDVRRILTYPLYCDLERAGIRTGDREALIGGSITINK